MFFDHHIVIAVDGFVNELSVLMSQVGHNKTCIGVWAVVFCLGNNTIE